MKGTTKKFKLKKLAFSYISVLDARPNTRPHVSYLERHENLNSRRKLNKYATPATLH